MIKIENLTKNYGKILAVDNVSFEVSKGSVLGFLGQNGAGKSTIMNIVTGYLAATSGKVYIDGVDIVENSIEARKKIGYMPQTPPLYGEMTVGEYLNFICDLRSVSHKFRKEQLDDIMYLTKIGEKKGRLVKNLSGGFKQRLNFAQALVGDPEIIVLDEPMTGFDVSQQIEFRKVINKLGRNHTLMISTHYLDEVSSMCSDVAIINNGKIARIGALSDFTTNSDGSVNFYVSLECDRDRGEKFLQSIPEIKSYNFARIEARGNVSVFKFSANPKAMANKAVFLAAAEAQIPILEMKAVEKSLEEEYMSIITKDNSKQNEESEG